MDWGELNILWVRHGYSCANDVKKKYGDSYNPALKYAHTTVKDPGLDCIGIKQAEDLAQDLKGDDLEPNIPIEMVWSSLLLRSIETAKIINDTLPFWQDWGGIEKEKQKVFLLPFITEIGNTDDNIPSKILPQLEMDIKNNISTIGNLGLYMPIPLEKYRKHPPSVENFKMIIPILCRILKSHIVERYEHNEERNSWSRGRSKPVMSFHDFYKENYTDKGGVNIVIVSHGGFIKKMMGRKLDNAQIVVQKVDLNTGQEKGFIERGSNLNRFQWSPYTKKYTTEECTRCKLTSEPLSYWRNEVKYNTSDDFILKNKGRVRSEQDLDVWKKNMERNEKDRQKIVASEVINYMQDKAEESFWFRSKNKKAKKSVKKAKKSVRKSRKNIKKSVRKSRKNIKKSVRKNKKSIKK